MKFRLGTRRKKPPRRAFTLTGDDMKIICLLLPLLLANLPQQTTEPVAHWSLAAQLVRNTVHGIHYKLKELIEEFPQLSEYRTHAQVTDLSLFYYKGAPGGCLVSAHFRYPLGPDEALPAEARVYRLKNGKRLAAWSKVVAGEDGRKFERAVGGLIRSKQAQLLDLLGADTRGSTRDLDAAPFEGTLSEGKVYRAELVFESEGWHWHTAVPLRAPMHHAAAIEWENLTDFAGVFFDQAKDGRPEVVFEVVKKEVEGGDRRGWKTTYRCRILGVESKEPPRADYVTLVAKCRGVRPTRKRSLGFYFDFEVRRVVAGSFAAGEFTMELTGTGGSALLRALRDDGPDWEPSDCAQAKEIEMTFELPRGEDSARHPGLLQEFRLVE